MKEKVVYLIKLVGPAFILASVVLGPGSITVSSRIGSSSGFSFIWVVLLAGLCMMVYSSMGARFGMVQEKSFLTIISEKYSKIFAVAIGIASFLAATSWQFGNNLGIGIAMKELTGVSEVVWPLIFTPLGIIMIFFSKNLYKVLEKIMMVLVMVMILAFAFNLILIKPDVVAIAKGVIPSSFTLPNMGIIAALVGTTFALTTAMYQSYLVKDKGWTKENLKEGISSINMGVFFLGLITLMIMITSASALYPKGIIVNSAAEMALQLEELFGSYAKYIFSFGLCAAAFSSLMINAVIGGGLLSDSLGLGKSMNEKQPKILTTVVLVIGMLVAVAFKGNVILAIIMAQASSMVGVPLIAVALLLVLNNKSVMGSYTNTKWQNFIGILGLVLIITMVYFMYGSIISKI